MEQLHTDPIGPAAGEEPLSDYVKRTESEENLRKLAAKLKDDLAKPTENEHSDGSTPDVSTPDVSTPDVSFEKFEAKRKQRDGQ